MTLPMTSNPTQYQDPEGEEHSQAVPNVESRHVKMRVNNNLDSTCLKSVPNNNLDSTCLKSVTNLDSTCLKSVNNRVTFSDEQDYEIHSKSPVECNS